MLRPVDGCDRIVTELNSDRVIGMTKPQRHSSQGLWMKRCDEVVELLRRPPMSELGIEEITICSAMAKGVLGIAVGEVRSGRSPSGVAPARRAREDEAG